MSETEILPGTVIADRFRVDGILGSGGYGEVYEGFQLSMRRKVAIKVLRPRLTKDGSTVERFQNEARYACQLSHPNTAVYHDFGWDRELSVMYLVMEYLAGQNLRDLIEGAGSLPLPEAVSLFEQICGSLEEAHSIGLIHRDVKPANIMILDRAGRSNFVKVIDFGIAKALEPIYADESLRPLTDSGVIIGSPKYMAPEQIRRCGRPVAPSADVYALGCLFFKTVTGLPPFRGATPMEIATKQVVDPPPTLAQQCPHGLHFPPKLEKLMVRVLSKEAADRPTSAGAFFDALLEAVGVDPEAVRKSSGEHVAAATYHRGAPTVLVDQMAQHTQPPQTAAARRHAERIATAPKARAQVKGSRRRAVALVGLALAILLLATSAAALLAHSALGDSGEPTEAIVDVSHPEGLPEIATAEGAPREPPPTPESAVTVGSARAAKDEPESSLQTLRETGSNPAASDREAKPLSTVKQRVTLKVDTWGTVAINGRRGDTFLQLQLTPGLHWVTVSRRGKSVRRRVVVRRGKTSYIVKAP